MPAIGALLSLAGGISTALLVWSLSELSQHRRTTAQRQAAIGRALVELLEVRHHLLGFVRALPHALRQFGASDADVAQTRAQLADLLPLDPDLAGRYLRALDEIAGTYPLLAFRLRTQHQTPTILRQLEQLAQSLATGPVDEAAIRWMMDHLTKKLLEALGESIQVLADDHGRRTRDAIRELLTAPIEDGADFTDYLKEIREGLTAAVANAPTACSFDHTAARPPLDLPQ